jgi:hypothetical protein
MVDNKQKIADSVIESCKDSIVSVVERYLPDLIKVGTEYEACCPFHAERSPSFKVNESKRFYYCFGCGASGDATDFVMAMEKVNFPEAVRRIAGNVAAGIIVKRPPSPPAESNKWKNITPIPESVGAPPNIWSTQIDGEWVKLKAIARWAYRDAQGNLLGYTCRFNMPKGGKDVIPQSWCVDTETGEASWRWRSLDVPRPLCGLDMLARYPKAQVLVLEGEKKVDAGYELAKRAGVGPDKLVFIAWPGGAKAISKVDWSPLYGRSVGLWPDADQKDYPDNHPKAGQRVPFLHQPGTAAMLAIYDQLEGHCTNIKFIVPPVGVPDGWDVADPFPAGLTLLGHAKAAGILASEVRAKFAVTPEPVAVDDSAPIVVEPPNVSPKAPVDEDEFDELQQNRHFTVLGYDHEDYFIFSHAKQQVMCVTKGAFGGDIGLIEMAEPNWWEEHFPSKDGINRKAAFAWFVHVAHSRGIYDPSRIRGRGAWRDNGRHVFHHGDHLTVDGQSVHIAKIQSGYVYPRARSLPALSREPLTDEEGLHLLEVAKMARWSMPASAALLVGWVMLAGICGALKWRPHLWLTGAAGSGKSTLLNDFVSTLLAGICVAAQGNSTEAGIRQRLKADALPVTLDEAEANSEKERQRIENILSMIRQSSSESQAETLKGTVSGDSMHFHVRSMFCLASINTVLDKKADIDRMTKLSLLQPKPGTVDRWSELEEELHKIGTNGKYPERILARAVGMLPTIHHNIAVFTKVAAKRFGSQRDGDQFGTLMAGAWSMISSHPVTDTQALMTIDKFDWKEHTEDHAQDDAMRALEAVLGSKIRMPGAIGEVSVFELIRESTTGGYREGLLDQIMAAAALRRHGMIVDESSKVVLFGVTVSNLAHLVEKTPFASDLRGQLLRVHGSCRWDKLVSFNGSKSRAIAIPIDKILGDAPNDPIL